MAHAHRPKMTESAADGLFEYRSVEKRKLRLTILLTGLMMLAEIAGGIFTNSLALLSDAGHMFTHLFALAISLGAIVCANAPSCSRRTFGFYRVEILAALFNSIFLFAVTAGILYAGIVRIMHPLHVLTTQMLVVAAIGLAVNLVSAWILHSASREDINVKSAFLHMWADTLSSVAIIIGAIVIRFTGWQILDPALSILITVPILAWGWVLLRDSVNILLEAAPKGITADAVSALLLKELPQVQAVDDLHVWEITSKMYSMTCHLRLKQGTTPQQGRDTLSALKRLVDEKFDIGHTTIEIS
jgi:cobalt-zinc-cadmium efflux system protein